MSTQNVMMIRASRLIPRFLPALAMAALIALAGSCSNPASNMTPPPPSFALSASSTSLSVQRGKQGSDTITVVPVNNFDGTVALTVSGLPSGVTAAFSPGSATTSSILTLTAASTASLVSSMLTITGTSSSLSATTAIDLTIVSGGFTLSASSTSLAIVPGGSGTDTITVLPSGGFNGSVALSASGLPAGVTATFNPASTTSTSSLTLTAASSATTGTSTITITGTSSGLSATLSVNLTVGGFSLSVSPAALTIEQGAVGTSIVTVTNSSNPVALSASAAPSGVTVSLNPKSTSTQSTLTLTVNSSTTVGASTITISGTFGGVTQTTSLGLTVTASASGGGLPASFFALSNVDPSDNPTTDGMTYGAVGHPDRLAWPHIEPTQGTFDFSLYDQYVAIAPREGPGGIVAVMDLTLGMTPQWATSDTSTCRTFPDGVVGCQAPPPLGQPYWQDFITALAQHYDGSSPSHPQIKYYEIWNEWNLQDSKNGYWTGTISDLVTLQDQACPIIHSIDQFSKVLTPSTVGPAQTWNDKAPQDLFAYLGTYGGSNCLGGPNNSVDGVSFHGIVADPAVITTNYPLPGEGCAGAGCNGAIQTMTSSYQQILTLSFAPGTVPPLFDTEGGFETANITDADQRAAWLAQFYALQAGLSTTDQLQWVSWFTWGLPGVPGNIEAANKTPDTAGVAYNQIFNWLTGKSPAPCLQTGSVWTCSLTGSSGYSAQIMWDDSQTCNGGTCTTGPQSAPSSATQWRDLAGVAHTITNGLVPVGLKPIIVEN